MLKNPTVNSSASSFLIQPGNAWLLPDWCLLERTCFFARLTAELLSSLAGQLSTCHPRMVTSTSFLGEFLQIKHVCGVFGVLLLCSASKQPVGGEVGPLSGKKPPSVQLEGLPVCSTQEMRGAGLQWKFFTASTKNSSEVKEVGTHSYRVISFLKTSRLRLQADLFIDTFVWAASVPKISCTSFLSFNTATTCGNTRANSHLCLGRVKYSVKNQQIIKWFTKPTVFWGVHFWFCFPAWALGKVKSVVQHQQTTSPVPGQCRDLRAPAPGRSDGVVKGLLSLQTSLSLLCAAREVSSGFCGLRL